MSGFNSRTLGRVRLQQCALLRLCVGVSIHAPWEGCDEIPNEAIALLILEFQFTHPGKGATANVSHVNRDHIVSIHAPWEGCDFSGSLISSHVFGFNSRTLGRVRPPPLKAPIDHLQFQFTHPGKGATNHPDVCFGHLCSFNSRTLGRVRRRRFAVQRPRGGVSIHAPWEGCDRSA